jgi:hypothetical protein
MTKTSEMMGDFAHPAGEAKSIDMDRVIALANEMRGLLEAIYRWNLVCDQEDLIAAWEYLNAMERAAWHKVVQARGRHADPG